MIKIHKKIKIYKKNICIKKKTAMHATFYLSAFLLLLSEPNALRCCTSIRIKSNDSGIICARTMEFLVPIKSEIIAIPRKKKLVSICPDGKISMRWKSLYTAVGMNAFGKDHLLEGINEKGLSCGALYFPGYAQYQQIEKHERKKAVAPWEFGTWLLTQCATVAEVKEVIAKEQIKIGAAPASLIGVALPHKGPDYVPPFHYSVHDAQGNSIVIEPINGILTVTDNPVGTLTNSPTFQWHLTNLYNYVNLSPINTSPKQLGEYVVRTPGQGSGMLGLPGDFTPASRFIRATLLSAAALPAENAYDAVSFAINIINNISIAHGMVQEVTPTGTLYESTQWVTVADLKNRRFYYRTYTNHRYKEIELSKLSFNRPTIKRLGIEEKAVYDKVTEKLK